MLPAPPPGYRLVAQLASGGMAEVYLGLRLGAGGLAKAVALKRMTPDLAADPEFVRMFLQEARIAVGLSHGNVTSVFELAEGGGAHYLVMEYVRGWDLARVLGACTKTDRALPPALAMFVAGEVAKALAYVHDRRDAEGRSLLLVHRDVSPPNVLVSIDGAVLLADFGIARAAAAATSTSPSWLKGKIPYMSPEQARAGPIDARSDLFSLGVVLFEMLTARRLFPGTEEAAMLAAVRAADAPAPSSVRAGIGPDVDRIVLCALAADPARRFQSAHEMQLELSRALRDMDPPAGSRELATFLAALGLPPPPDPLALATAAVDAPPARAETRLEPAVQRARVPAKDPDSRTDILPRPAGSSSDAQPSPAAVGRRRGRTARLAAAVALAALVAFAAASVARRALRPAGVPERPTRLEVRSPTSGSTVRIDGEARGEVPLVLEGLPRRQVELRVEKDGFVPFVRSLDLAADPDQVVDVPLDSADGGSLR